MESRSDSLTQNWSFDAVLARLKHREQVEGLLLIGSHAKNEMTPASDYDLVIFLKDAPRPWFVGVTIIASRFTDLIFVNASALKSIQALEAPISLHHELAPLVRWLKSGRIIFDRSGQVENSQRQVQDHEWIAPVADEAAYAAWFGLNYNLAVAQRMAASADPIYLITMVVRMAVYGHSDLWFGYFTLRKMAWDGDKAAVHYLHQNDPAFLEAFQQFISTAPLPQKLLLYRQAAALAAAPLGGLWTPDSTVMNDAQTSKIWQELLGGSA